MVNPPGKPLPIFLLDCLALIMEEVSEAAPERGAVIAGAIDHDDCKFLREKMRAAQMAKSGNEKPLGEIPCGAKDDEHARRCFGLGVHFHHQTRNGLRRLRFHPGMRPAEPSKNARQYPAAAG